MVSFISLFIVSNASDDCFVLVSVSETPSDISFIILVILAELCDDVSAEIDGAEVKSLGLCRLGHTHDYQRH